MGEKRIKKRKLSMSQLSAHKIEQDPTALKTHHVLSSTFIQCSNVIQFHILEMNFECRSCIYNTTNFLSPPRYFRSKCNGFIEKRPWIFVSLPHPPIFRSPFYDIFLENPSSLKIQKRFEKHPSRFGRNHTQILLIYNFNDETLLCKARVSL